MDVILGRESFRFLPKGLGQGRSDTKPTCSGGEGEKRLSCLDLVQHPSDKDADALQSIETDHSRGLHIHLPCMDWCVSSSHFKGALISIKYLICRGAELI